MQRTQRGRRRCIFLKSSFFVFLCVLRVLCAFAVHPRFHLTEEREWEATMSVTPAIYNFSDPAVQANPYPIYERLRQEAPVFWNGPYWLVSRYDDIVALLNDPRVSSARVEATFAVLPEEVQMELQPLWHVLGSRMLLSDPPRHTRLRTLMTKAFSARVTETKRER